MWLNFMQAFRHLRRRPVLTAAGILSLALGIGCALASASVVNAVLFRAFPYRDTDRLALVWENNAKRGVGLTPTSVLNYKDLNESATTFERLGAFVDASVSLDGPDGSERAFGYKTTAGLLDETHVAPIVGRVFTAEEDRPGSPEVVVLSHGVWQRRFGGDPNIVGHTIRLTGVPYTVIGVMPRGFMLPPVFTVRLVGVDVVLKEADFWAPLKIDDMPQRRDARSLFVLGRLKAGRSLAESQAEASIVGGRLASTYTVDDFGLDFTVVPLETQVLANVRTLLLLLLFVGALVLIIAAADAAHLLLADSLTTSGETAVRSALGATTWRLASQQGMLSLVWCLLATGGAIVVAIALQSPVAAYTSANVPRLNEVKLDGTVIALAAAIGVALALGISLLPIRYARKAGSTRSIGAVSVPVGMPRWRRGFVVVQLAIAIVVLSTAALLSRSADALARVNPGFVADKVSVFELMLPTTRYGSPASRIEFQRRLLDLVAGLPGQRAAATVDYLPFGGSTAVINFTVEHTSTTDAMKKPRAALRAVSASYFDVLSIPTIEGRRFTSTDEDLDGDEADVTSAAGVAQAFRPASVAIVNDAFARQYLAGQTAIGRRVKRGDPNSKNPWLTIVGVVGSVRGGGLDTDASPEIFLPYVKGGSRSMMSLIVKTDAPGRALASAIVDRIHRADAALSPTAATDMHELIAHALGQPYFYARLFGVLAGVAFVLGLVGVYSVAALGVSARSTEIAIRSCLGAQPSDIVRMVLRETALAASAAAAAGTLGAWLLQKKMAAFVYGVESTDWAIIAASAVVLSALALAASYLAVRRASEIQPLVLLKRGAGALA